MLLAQSPTPVPDRFMSIMQLSFRPGAGASERSESRPDPPEHAVEAASSATVADAPPARAAPAVQPAQQSAAQPVADSTAQAPQQPEAADMYTRHAELSGTDAQEPLLAPNEERFCMYPIRWAQRAVFAHHQSFARRQKESYAAQFALRDVT